MTFCELPVHSWFFISPEAKFPKYKSGEFSYQGWNIRWDTSISPDQEVFEAVFCQQERIYVPVPNGTENTKKTTKEWGKL